MSDLRRQIADIAALVSAGVADLQPVATTLGEASKESASEALEQRAVIRECAQATEGLAESAARIDETLRSLLENAASVADAAEQFEGGLRPVATGSGSLRGDLDDTATSVEQLTSAIGQISLHLEQLGDATYGTNRSLGILGSSAQHIVERANAGEESSAAAMAHARTGLADADSARDTMQSIAESFTALDRTVLELSSGSSEIGEVVRVIEDIADETGLLALNASIIAAQAGEQGRAFGVVADSVRQLARRTSGSTKQVGERIKAVQRAVSTAVEAMAESGERLDDGVAQARAASGAFELIVVDCESTNDAVLQIAQAASRQSDDTMRARETMDTVEGLIVRIAQAAAEQDQACSEVGDALGRMRSACSIIADALEGSLGESNRIRTALTSLAEGIEQIGGTTAGQREQTLELRRALATLDESSEASFERTSILEDSVDHLLDGTRRLAATTEHLGRDAERANDRDDDRAG